MAKTPPLRDLGKRMGGYYSEKLSDRRLQLCYEIAPPRVKQYLEAEIRFVLDRIKPSDFVLELGCGYGRVLERLEGRAALLVGIDISPTSLNLAKERLPLTSSFRLLLMDAVNLGFGERKFDMVFCIQNGLSAFQVNQKKLIEEALRVTRRGGKVLFSSYADRFWKHRLQWFRLQSQHGLIGEIDESLTGDGMIICKDGFRAATIRPGDFFSLISGFNLIPQITEVDGSSVFCEIEIQ